MMNRYIKLFIFTSCLGSSFPFVASAEWKQSNAGWRYESSDGFYVQDGWKQIEGQWYFFDEEGYCLMNTLTPDGYWVDENGHFDEQKRIYGKCVFSPTKYVKTENKYLITGEICDTGYMDQEVINQIQKGDMIITPSPLFVDRVCEFNFMQPVENIINEGGKQTLVTSYVYRWEGIEWLEWDSVSGNLIECNYYLNSQDMSQAETYSTGFPVYRIVVKDVTLIADENTKYKMESDIDEFSTLEQCLDAWTGNDWVDKNKVWEIYLKGSHIEEAVNIEENYVG